MTLTFRERVISPTCCEQMQTHLAVQLRIPYFRFIEGENAKPVWKLVLNFEPDHVTELLRDKATGQLITAELADEWAVAAFCPFCATKIPEIVPAQPDPNKKYCQVTDGGYYCNTCKERLNACTCYPPEHLWAAMP